MTKAEYITNSLSKINHKKWELYVISRIIHKLDDLDIEFICQQHILLENSSAFADMFFPQFNIYLEINESHHSKNKNKILDEIRRLEILRAIGAKQYQILTYIEVNEEVSDIKLSALNTKIDEFVSYLRDEKVKLLKKSLFKSWDFTNKYNPQKFIDLGYLDIEDNPSFKTHRDVLRCFGYSKGHYQRGTWCHPSWIDKEVWFPRFVEHGIWRNVLSEDERMISETLLKKSIIDKHINSPKRKHTKYTFAKTRDRLGTKLYRFVGEFKFVSENLVDGHLQRKYVLNSSRINLRKI